MISNGELERLIAQKRCEIEKEKIVLGLSAAGDAGHLQDQESKENQALNQDGFSKARRVHKTVRIDEGTARHDDVKKQAEEAEIPAELERYIRRYLGLPVMLKAGEFSPNNPLLRAERGAGGDAFLGFGEYERRRNTLRKIRQQQYREFLDQQAKKKQEAKEQAERERREKEEKERLREEEREKVRQAIEREKAEAEKRRLRLHDDNVERERVKVEDKIRQKEYERRAAVCYVPFSSNADSNSCRSKVDTGVQVGVSQPLSVGVQTDDAEIYRLPPSPTKCQLTQAERELSPRTVLDHDKSAYQDNRSTRYDNRPLHIDNRPLHHNNKDVTHDNEHTFRRGKRDASLEHDSHPYNDGTHIRHDNQPLNCTNNRQDHEVKDNIPLHRHSLDRLHDDKPVCHDGLDRLHDDKPVRHDGLDRLHDDKPVRHDGLDRLHDDKPVRHDGLDRIHDNMASNDERPIQPAAWTKADWNEEKDQKSARRRSYGDFDERSSNTAGKCPRSRLLSELRHSYMPSIFDADAIHMRNLQAEKEATERRAAYQRELREQIQEQKRLKDERSAREKMLEAAEMRRLEEQLRMLRAAQGRERGRQRDTADKMKESAADFERQRTLLQKEIDDEQKLLRAHRNPTTSYSDTDLKLPPFYNPVKRLPFSTNISENSIFNPDYDVDSYLRKNLNPKTFVSKFDVPENSERNIIVEKALIHDRPKDRRDKPKYEPTFLKHLDELKDDTPIPVLRHSPKTTSYTDVEDNVSSGMKLIEDKWKVPAVQKNILKNIPKEDGKNVSILTQLGSIRRQLQLEQLRLDNMKSKSD